MQLTVVCAWCTKVMQEGSPDAEVTHGMCPSCAEYFDKDEIENVQQFLDRLPAPVLMVDDSGTVLTVNLAAQSALAKELPKIRGYKGGDVMECAYSKRPGGCGNTEHCAACTIRNTVMDTHADGMSRIRHKAYQDIKTPDGEAKMRFLISTEKVGKVVLLRIDEMQQVA